MSVEQCELLCLDLPRAEELRAGLPGRARLERAARRAAALSDPTRLAAATALREAGELCGCDLAWVLGRAENLVSHHLRVLREAGLISSRREGKTVFHSLTDPGRALLDVVVEGRTTSAA